jgi:hypothetical protein
MPCCLVVCHIVSAHTYVILLTVFVSVMPCSLVFKYRSYVLLESGRADTCRYCCYGYLGRDAVRFGGALCVTAAETRQFAVWTH